MKVILHTSEVFLAILVFFTTCKGQQQGRPYFPNQQAQNLQDGVPINTNNGIHILPNVQQQYPPQPVQGVQDQQQQQPQKNFFFVNSAKNENQPVGLPENTFLQNGQMYKRVGNLPDSPGQNVQHFNQGNNQIDTKLGTSIVGSKDVVEGHRNEIHDFKVTGKAVINNTADTAKVTNGSKQQNAESQVIDHGSVNQKVLDVQGINSKPNNDSKSVFVINKNRFYNSDNIDKLKEQQGELTDTQKNGIASLEKVNGISQLDNKEPAASNVQVIQDRNLIDSNVRFPLNNSVDKVAEKLGQENTGANELQVNKNDKQPVSVNNSLPVDPKLNKSLALNSNEGIPVKIEVINGEVEKNKGGDAVSEDYDDDEDDDQKGGGARSDIEPEKRGTLSNEIPRDVGGAADMNNPNKLDHQYHGQQQNNGPQWNFGPPNAVQQNNLNTGQQLNNGQQDNNVPQINVGQPANFGQQGNNENKEGSLKIVWDWSDFAVNFEQYLAPEQKIRRAPHATTGEPWPLPQYYIAKHDVVYRLDKSLFHFKLSKVKCDIIDKAIERYKSYILEDSVQEMYDNFQNAQSTLFEDPTLKYETPTYTEAPVHALVSVKIKKPCAKLPSEKMDESYDLFVKRTGIFLWANEVWGALRGLETFSQLVFKGADSELYVKDTVINDYPRFSHRGVLIDSSRHFIFKETIFDALEGLAQNKMNVMHWHIVDDQSFPFQSKAYPDLSEKGAFHPSFVYSPEDIAEVIEFARLRGIRVEPEFDTPGHTYSWGLSRPDLLTQCYQGDRPVDGYLGPLDPSKNETFRFLKNFFKDVLHTFKDQYLHLGGDEVPMTCWSSNPEVLRLLAKLEGRPEPAEGQRNDPYYYSYDIRKVLEYYVKRLMTDVKQVGVKRPNNVRFVFWQEIMNNDVQLPNDTIIQVWQGGMEEVQRATSLGLNVIYSTCWYLDLIEYGTKWSKYYHCDPVDTMYGYTIDESKVLGGEACLWAEYIDNENLMSTLWPRASATAERLWSHKDVRDIDTAAARLQEHRCRMLSRGLAVGQISGPDYCLRRGKRHHTVNNTQSLNCTLAQCASFAEKGRVEIEKIKVEFQQKGGPISDCSQTVLQAGGNLALIVLVLIILAIGFTLKFTKKKIVQVRMCRNKTILLIFVTLILIYFMCYTSIWMQALQFKGSFEKRISSNSNLDKVS